MTNDEYTSTVEAILVTRYASDRSGFRDRVRGISVDSESLERGSTDNVSPAISDYWDHGNAQRYWTIIRG